MFWPGSSPRGRGTCRLGAGVVRVPRFIPAWAGNITYRRRHRSSRPVHPRVGGEHEVASEVSLAEIGSSPRGRGTCDGWGLVRPRSRFIPAWAGNIFELAVLVRFGTVHPRVGGEHWLWALRSLRNIGSSPRGRGTSYVRLRLPDRCRFIPAWAGNIGESFARNRSSPVHPRVGGEHISASGGRSVSHGSSPRGRGTSRRRRPDA